MMTRTRTIAAAGSFLFVLAGCHHTNKGVQQTAAPSAPAIGPIMVSVPPPTHHDQPQVAVEPVPAPTTPPEPPRHVARTPRKAPAGSATSPATTPPQAAAITSPVELGALSAGGETSIGYKQQTADLLKSQQQRLAALSRADIAAHPTEIVQVRTFLQKASTSWDAADYEGAHTLVVKAKVLLDDLHR